MAKRKKATLAIDLLKSIFTKDLLPITQDIMEEPSVMAVPVFEDVRFPHLLFRHAETEHGRLLPFFERGMGLSEMCDYILFAETTDVLHVCFIELKATDTDGALEQLNAAETFMNFVFASCSRIEKPIEKEIKRYKVVILKERQRTKKATSQRDFMPNPKGVILYRELEFRIANLIA